LQRISLSTPIIEKHNFLTPLNLQNLTSGLRHFVKTYGAELRPNGRTEKQKYLTEPAKTQEKPKKSLMIWENIKMVITGLKIKTKKVITLVNIR